MQELTTEDAGDLMVGLPPERGESPLRGSAEDRYKDVPLPALTLEVLANKAGEELR